MTRKLRDALRLLLARCVEATAADGGSRNLIETDVRWACEHLANRLREATDPEEPTFDYTLPPARTGVLQHLQQLVDQMHGEHDAISVANLTDALKAFLDDEIGPYGEEEENGMRGRQDEPDGEARRGWRCEACGHYQGDQIEKGKEDDEAEPANPVPSDGIASRGPVADVSSPDLRHTADRQTIDDAADDEDPYRNPASAVRSPSALERAARVDSFRRYAEAEERGVRLGIGTYRAREEASARDGHCRYQGEPAAEARRIQREAAARWRELTRAPAPTKWSDFFDCDSGDPHRALRIDDRG